MMNDPMQASVLSSVGVIWLLRIIHIGAGVFWVGSMLFFARFIFPSAMALGPAAGPFMDQLNRVRKVPAALLGAAVATILSGLLLYWRASMGFQGAWMRSPTGIVFGLGGLFALTAFFVGVLVNRPTALRLGELGAAIHAKGGPPSPDQAAEMQRLQARLGVALRAVATLLVLATLAMALARYVT
jgi:uncharacterized membrane protein